ncbi:glycoside hydrolase [Clathrospora elynae]|uniref:AA9 family lytic polysaccharide monooxygenase n=1 Tax=Clathrospora elynae TaxID=706981 RepID=A0A6A5T5T8_9PLEO|nr:glycoside hydrolase [Clathrospora elynae]
MKLSISLALVVAFTSTTVFVHGGVTTYIIDNTSYPGYVWYDPLDGQKDLIQRTWDQNPHTDPLSSNLTCNYHGTPVPGAFHAPVRAGSTIRTSWNQNSFGWVHTVGPVIAYLASCPGGDCSTIANIADISWFKIAEEGLRKGFALGGPRGLNTRTDYWDVVVPLGLKPGKYMVRHEIINLELAPVLFYPNCAQLEVQGEGESFPADNFLVKFPGAYSTSDPGIAISGKVKQDKFTKNYTVPGPKVWTG